MAKDDEVNGNGEHPDGTGPEPAETTGAAHDGDPANVTPIKRGNGAPLSERAEQQEEDNDGQQALILDPDGKKVTLGSLVKGSTPVEYHYKMTGKAIHSVSKEAVLDPYESSFVMVADCVVDSIKPAYIRDGEGKVTKVNLYVELKPRVLQNALTEAGEVIIAEAKKAKAAKAAA